MPAVFGGGGVALTFHCPLLLLELFHLAFVPRGEAPFLLRFLLVVLDLRQNGLFVDEESLDDSGLEVPV